MTTRELIIQELEQVPEAILRAVLDFLRFLKREKPRTVTDNPLLQFAGILSDDEANELERTIAAEFEQVNLHEW
jgi:hypothetical protein